MTAFAQVGVGANATPCFLTAKIYANREKSYIFRSPFGNSLGLVVSREVLCRAEPSTARRAWVALRTYLRCPEVCRFAIVE